MKGGDVYSISRASACSSTKRIFQQTSFNKTIAKVRNKRNDSMGGGPPLSFSGVCVSVVRRRRRLRRQNDVKMGSVGVTVVD